MLRIAIAAAGIGVLALSFDSFRGLTLNRSSDRQAPIVVAARPAPAPVPPPQPQAARKAEAISAIALGPRARFRKPVTLAPPYLPVDASNFVAADQKFAVSGVVGPPSNAVCRDDSGALWICGLEARAALYNLIRLETLVCQRLNPDQRLATGAPIPVECRIRGRDLATELVRAGFVRPSGLVGLELAAAAEDARSLRRGLWRGGWTIVR